MDTTKLKVGDRVMYDYGGWTVTGYVVSTIAKVGKNGCTLADGTRWTASGSEWGKSSSRHGRYLREYDAEQISETEREQERKRLAAALDDINWRKLTLAQLQAVDRALSAATREGD